MALDFSNLQSAVASAISAEPASAPSSSATAVAEPPSAPASPSPSTPASTPVSAPASPTVPTPTETPSTPEDDDFAWPSEDGTPAEPADEAPATPEVTPEGQPTPQDDPANWKPEDIDKMLPRQVIDKMLQTQKGRNIYQSYMTMRELEKPVTEGGLGFRPSIEQIREMHQDSTDMQMMVHEFQHADQNPQYAQNWTKQWFQVGQDGKPTPHAMAVASQLAPVLDGHSPDLYRAVAKPIIGNYIEELYRQADSQQDPEQRVVMFNVARIIEQDINGKARDVPEEVWKGGKPSQPQSNPELEEVRQGKMQIEQFRQGQQVAAQNAFIAQMNGGIRGALTKDIQFALKPVAEAYKGADGKPSRAYQALEVQFHNDVVKQMTSNPAQLRNYIIARDQARATRDPNDIQNAARAYAAAARPVIAQLRKPYLQDAIALKTAESTQRHQVLDEASQKRGSTSIGQPTEKNVVPNTARQPGETHEEWVRRRVESVVGAVA